MEEWQKSHIKSHLKDLIHSTNINKSLEANLLSNDIFSDTDIRILDAEKNEETKAFIFYRILQTRRKAYKIFTKALIDNKQSCAAKILINGPIIHGFSRPLTYLGISLDSNEFPDVCIKVHGKIWKINQFFGDKSLLLLQQIFRDSIPELEFYETFVKKERTFVLTNDTIPPKPPFYIPRLLSNQIKLNESIFGQDCRDVFVFKKTIKRFKVSRLASDSRTRLSSTQLNLITSRFIYLDNDEDWVDLKKLSKEPIHLINYVAEQDLFLLEDTSAPSVILRKLGSQNDRVYKSEDNFVQQQLTKYPRASSVCICAAPGMGKTYLLTNIARYMAANSTGSIILCTTMSKFTDYYLSTLLSDTNHPSLLVSILKYASQENALLLYKLVKAKLLQIEVFIDGYDETQSDKADWITQKIKLITTECPKVRVFISSKLHMREKLEECFHTISYDILPFDHQMQEMFMFKFWSIIKQNHDSDLVRNYATKCLEATNRSLSTTDKRITENPRLCEAIAELYADKIEGRKNYKFPSNNFTTLKMVIEHRIMKSRNFKKNFPTQKQKVYIKSVHTCHALKMIFPTHSFHHDDIFGAPDPLMSSDILQIGILQQYANAANAPFEFIHTALAAYLVADYFSTRLNNKIVFKTLLKCVLDASDKKNILHSKIVASSCDYALLNISDEVKQQVVNLCNMILPQDLFTLLCACCQQNLENLFSFLKKASKARECFTPINSNELLLDCIQWKTCHMFYCCVRLFIELGVAQIVPSDKQETILQLAVKFQNFEAVDYLVKKVPLQCQNILEVCIGNSWNNDAAEIRSREEILMLLLQQDPSLVNEASALWSFSQKHPRLINILEKAGAKLTKEAGGSSRSNNGENTSLDRTLPRVPSGVLDSTYNDSATKANIISNIKNKLEPQHQVNLHQALLSVYIYA